jgi:hypothetical protein
MRPKVLKLPEILIDRVFGQVGEDFREPACREFHPIASVVELGPWRRIDIAGIQDGLVNDGRGNANVRREFRIEVMLPHGQSSSMKGLKTLRL